MRRTWENYYTRGLLLHTWTRGLYKITTHVDVWAVHVIVKNVRVVTFIDMFIRWQVLEQLTQHAHPRIRDHAAHMGKLLHTRAIQVIVKSVRVVTCIVTSVRAVTFIVKIVRVVTLL